MIQPVLKGHALLADMAAPLPEGLLALWWLGQSGFALRWGQRVFYVDIYLSDHLAKKYRGTEKPHDRLTEAPLLGAQVTNAHLAFCTHRHSDHLDPEALPGVLQASPHCRVVLPRAILGHALAIGLPEDRLIPMNAGDRLAFGDLDVTAVPSAHDGLDVTTDGLYPYLGYVMRFDSTTVYHPGDTIPYPGLAEVLRAHRIDVALLPISGRDARRRALGTAGNLTPEEAAQLAHAAGAKVVVPHHYDMFAFNTGEPAELVRCVCARGLPLLVKLLCCGERWTYGREDAPA